MERKQEPQKRGIGAFRPKKSLFRWLYAGESSDVRKYSLNFGELPIKATKPSSNSESAGLHGYVRKVVGRWGSEKITKEDY